ncbi:MAG: hypothetical protein ACRC33_28830 [Gemmataceae bacterium]
MQRVTVIVALVVLGGFGWLASAKPVPADPPAARVKWEYRVEQWVAVVNVVPHDVDYADDLKDEHFKRGLAALGEQGWELVAVQGEWREPKKGRYFFKRAK